MASKIDGVIDTLEQLTRDVNQLKRRVVATPFVPLPPKAKATLAAGMESFDDAITDAYFSGVRGVADVVLPANVAREVINDPGVLMDSNGTITRITAKPSKKPSKVTPKMKKQRKIQSKAFENANAKGRKVNGEFKKGWDQSRIARVAQKECTKERERLGLCKKKSTRKGQVRKTARRAYEKR